MHTFMANSSSNSLISQFCLHPMLLGLLAISASLGHPTDQAIAETPKPVNASPITGTWKLTPKNPSFSVNLMPPLLIIITPEGKFFVQDPLRQDEYTEVGIIRKSSDNSSLPPNAKILPPHSSANRVRNLEAKDYVGSMNRGQQAYFLENVTWGKSLKELQLPFKSETENYRYSIQVNKAIATITTKPYTDAGIAINLGIARKPNLKSYVGIVWLQEISVPKEVTSYARLCESIEPTMKLPPIPKWDGREMKCPEGYKTIF